MWHLLDADIQLRGGEIVQSHLLQEVRGHSFGQMIINNMNQGALSWAGSVACQQDCVSSANLREAVLPNRSWPWRHTCTTARRQDGMVSRTLRAKPSQTLSLPWFSSACVVSSATDKSVSARSSARQARAQWMPASASRRAQAATLASVSLVRPRGASGPCHVPNT